MESPVNRFRHLGVKGFRRFHDVSFELRDVCPAWIQEAFRTGNRKRAYIKTRDAGRILLNRDLTVAANACPELKSFLNTLLTLCGSAALL
jgi:hypothetical protein